MTTEDEFQVLLDANPEDFQTRLVFADWLQEQNDPRAEGYRALGQIQFRPWPTWWVGNATPDLVAKSGEDEFRVCLLASDWFELITTGMYIEEAGIWRRFGTRREAEDATALAFAKLPPERRAGLLAGGA